LSSDFVVDATCAAWLTLALMMLLSRIAFQAAGPVRMRAFLTGWQRSAVKRVWGLATLMFAGFLVAAALVASGELTTFEILLLGLLVAVLALDGTVNALPSGFETFKDRVQTAWVRRTPADQQGDSQLFATVNAALAAASVGVAAVVLAYGPIDEASVVAAVIAALVLTPGLIAASVLTARHR
jgi:hypothetical protein